MTDNEHIAITRFKRVWQGPSNSGVARISATGTGVKPPKVRTIKERILIGVERASNRFKAEIKADARNKLTDEERIRAADELRSAADRVQRGS